MSDMEFAASAPSLGEATPVAPLGQGGAEDSGTSTEAVTNAQIADTPADPASSFDWTQDPKFREYQSKKDREIAAIQAEARRAAEEAARVRQELEAERQRLSEDSFKRDYEREWHEAPTEAAKQQVVFKYQQLQLERQQEALNREKSTIQATRERDQIANTVHSKGVPADVIRAAIAAGGNDLNRQQALINEYALNYLAQARQQGYVPTAAPAAAAPVQPMTMPAPAPAPLRRPATPIATPGSVTPAPLTISQLYNTARAKNTPEAWHEYRAAKQAAVSEARMREHRSR